MWPGSKSYVQLGTHDVPPLRRSFFPFIYAVLSISHSIKSNLLLALKDAKQMKKKEKMKLDSQFFLMGLALYEPQSHIELLLRSNLTPHLPAVNRDLESGEKAAQFTGRAPAISLLSLAMVLKVLSTLRSTIYKHHF